MTHNQKPKTGRIDMVDALRGFAVMAILLVHCLEHFIFPVYPDPATQPEWLNVANEGVFTLVFSLFAGKSYAIFALLFGFTFYIQYTNRQLAGNDFGYRFLWRLLLLAGFATINAAFFPGGDVLLLFAVVGVCLFVVRRWSNRAVLIATIVLLLQPVEWFHFIVGLCYPSYKILDLGVGSMYGEIAEYTKGGSIGSFLVGNVTLGQKASLLWAVGAGRVMQTAGLFMLGLLIGRSQLFVSSQKSIQFWVKVLIISAVAFGPLYQFKVMLYDNGGSDLLRQSVGVILDMWQKLAFTLVLVSSFVLLYQTSRFQKLTSPLRVYGKMSLTNYITQSILGALIFFPVGLYLAPYCGYLVSLLIGIVLLVLQVMFCKLWAKRYKQGPLETIWHRLTWIGARK